MLTAKTVVRTLTDGDLAKQTYHSWHITLKNELSNLGFSTIGYSKFLGDWWLKLVQKKIQHKIISQLIESEKESFDLQFKILKIKPSDQLSHACNHCLIMINFYRRFKAKLNQNCFFSFDKNLRFVFGHSSRKFWIFKYCQEGSTNGFIGKSLIWIHTKKHLQFSKIQIISKSKIINNSQ